MSFTGVDGEAYPVEWGNEILPRHVRFFVFFYFVAIVLVAFFCLQTHVPISCTPSVNRSFMCTHYETDGGAPFHLHVGNSRVFERFSVDVSAGWVGSSSSMECI